MLITCSTVQLVLELWPEATCIKLAAVVLVTETPHSVQGYKITKTFPTLGMCKINVK